MLYGFGIYDFLREILKKFEVTFIITIVSLFVLVIYIAQIILKVSLMPEYIPQRLVVVAVSTLPFISYVAEGYLATRKVKYGGIVAGGTSFSFSTFYYLHSWKIEALRRFFRSGSLFSLDLRGDTSHLLCEDFDAALRCSAA